MTSHPVADFVPVRVELTSGIVTQATLTTGAGASWLPHEIGRRMFYVAVVETDESYLIMWNGSDYGEAIRAAEESRADWGISEPVHDLVVISSAPEGGAQ